MPGLYLPDLSNIVTVLDHYIESSGLHEIKYGSKLPKEIGIDNIEFFPKNEDVS